MFHFLRHLPRLSLRADPSRAMLAPRGGPADAPPIAACLWNNWRAAWC
jgi:hypothetical protein